MLFTQLMSVSAVPEIWKMAIVTPVLKKGPATDLANYRPISLTCVAGKIMERIIVSNDLLLFRHWCYKQSPARVSQRTVHSHQSHWTVSIQAQKSVTVAYIDFAKAFDTVSPPKLLHRLKTYGIDGCLLNWT